MRGKLLPIAFGNELRELGQANDAGRMRLALIGAGQAVFDWTLADDRIVWDGADVLLHHHPDPTILETGRVFHTWLTPQAYGRFLSFVEEVSPADPVFAVEFEANADDHLEWFEIRAVRVPRPDGKAERVAGVLRPITEQKILLTQLSHLATCDELTGQLNRTRLREELDRAISAAEERGRSCAYLVTSIDNLAVINETYGFDIADEVIVATGKRLARYLRGLRGGDVIGRTAGNKFGVVLCECGEGEMSAITKRLQAAIRDEVIETWAGAVSATISVGAVWLPESAKTSQEAMLRADEALERAKSMGRNGFTLYVKSAQKETYRRRLLTIGDELMAALDDNRLIFAYQPIVAAISRQPEHYECLVRLAREDGTIVAAGDFIPAAESLGLVHLVDRRALEVAVAQLHAHPKIKLSINVSGTTANDQSWLESFLNYVKENSAVAERMAVELTETAALQAFEESAQFVSRLREMGCRVAIDDFGAGYTSFRNLHMRFDMVKIDGSYIKNLSASPDNQLFVRTLVELAKNFQLDTVAEWVDSEEDAALLVKFGVDYFQGFYFGAPEIAPEWMGEAPRAFSAEAPGALCTPIGSPARQSRAAGSAQKIRPNKKSSAHSDSI